MARWCHCDTALVHGLVLSRSAGRALGVGPAAGLTVFHDLWQTVTAMVAAAKPSRHASQSAGALGPQCAAERRTGGPETTMVARASESQVTLVAQADNDNHWHHAVARCALATT